MQSRQPDTSVSYRFYATLLDGFQDYLNSDTIWEKYWGYSENPPHTPEEFKQKQFQSFIDRINRVPFDSEAADKGTAFNEIIDCMIENRKSDKVEVRYAYEAIVMGQVDNCDPDERWGDVVQTNKVVGLHAYYNNRAFYFDINLCREFANYYKGALTQQFVKAIVPTRYGNVEVYGYVDELMPQSIHDIKTTGKYSVGKFKEHWQHIVYPYCYQQNGIDIRLFEYNIAEIDKYGRWETFTESYMYKPERDVPRLVNMCEELIRFLKENRHLITDRKIFNLVA